MFRPLTLALCLLSWASFASPQPQIPYGPPHFHAMGDSYSAGPGAGGNYDDAKYGDNKCFRGTGAYGPKLDALKLDKFGNFQFLSCTGHTTKDVVQYQFKDLSWHEINSKMTVLLSIGGNDLKFSKYIKACLLGIPGTDCAAVNSEIDNLINNRDGQYTLQNALESVWSGYRHRDSYGFSRSPPILQTGYPEFFAETTDYCDDVRISLGKVVFGPKMTKQLRKDTNALVRQANAKIKQLVDGFQLQERNFWMMGYHQYVDYNPSYNGHRLCESFVTDGVGFSNKDVWFIGVLQSDADDDDENTGGHGTITDSVTYSQVDPNTCNPESGDLGLSVACSLVRYKQTNPDFDLSTVTLPKWITKGFHPKSSGFNRIRDQLEGLVHPNRATLRVLALGDSITDGFQSSDGNGYRKTFYDFASEDRKVDMIGSLRAGNMGDPDNEGHSGATISQISGYADASLPARPNVVLLHAGTNDMGSDANAAGAVDRLAALVDKILTKCPDAAVLVAKIVPSTDAARQARANSFNAGVATLVSTRRAAGKQIQLMSMNQAVTTADLADSLHPNDAGYRNMGNHWYGGVLWADQQGWIKNPVDGQSSGGGKAPPCSSLPNWIPQGEIANGGGNGFAEHGIYACYATDCHELQVYSSLVQCSGDCQAGECVKQSDTQYKCLSCDSKPAAHCTCAHPDGSVFEEPNPTGGPCKNTANQPYSNVQFADIDGDGRDDYLWVGEKGQVIMYRNGGNTPENAGVNAGKVIWYPMGQIASGVGNVGRQVRFADLDGDGRADYVWVKDDGSATVWWNLGFDGNRDPKVIWHSATGEQIASGIGDGGGVRFADMNGDGKADFIHMDRNAAATLYINQGRNADGTWGWWNWGVVASGVGGNRNFIRFADMNGDGQADYCVVDQFSGRLDVWYNQGPTSKSWSVQSGMLWWNSTSQKNAPVATGVSYLEKWTDGDMITFGDLNGDGRDEYLMVGKYDSSVYAFLNGC